MIISELPKKYIDILLALFGDGYKVSDMLTIKADKIKFEIRKNGDKVEIQFSEPKIQCVVDNPIPFAGDIVGEINKVVIGENKVSVDIPNIPDFLDPEFKVK